MFRRFDFDYWPPLPVEQPPVTPAQNAPSEELCRDLLLITDTSRHHAVHASGEWANVEDFWIESVVEPKPDQLYSQGILSVIGPDDKPALRVRSRRHLQNATYTFRRVAYELAAMDEDANDHPYLHILDDEIGADFQGDTRTEGFLFHHVFAQWDKRFSDTQVLIARRALVDIFEGTDPLPLGVGKDGQVIIAKVALRWHESIQHHSIGL